MNEIFNDPNIPEGAKFQIAQRKQQSLFDTSAQIGKLIEIKKQNLQDIADQEYNKAISDIGKIKIAIDNLKAKTEVFYSEKQNSCIALIYKIDEKQNISIILKDLFS